MESRFLVLKASLVLGLLTLSSVSCHFHKDQATAPAARPLVKRPEGTKYKTILASDFGGLRGLIATMVFIRLEQSIKQYLLEHPHLLPADAVITSIEDFDINLVDYFDCMTGISAGAESMLFLASRGGQGAARALTEDPEIVERYGAVLPASAQGLRIFYRELGALVYPPNELGAAGGSVFDLSNPLSVGVAQPVYSSTGFQRALEIAFGNTTLADLDTSVVAPILDIITSRAVLFVQNAFRDPSVTSSARLIPRSSPKSAPTPGSRFTPDLVFDEGKNYYLVDVGVGAGSAPLFNLAHSVSQVNNETEEFLLMDGVVPIEDAALYASHFVISESNASGFEDIAILSVGTARVVTDYSGRANAGLAGWLQGLALRTLYQNAGLQAQASLMDYIYYSNPETKPHQYLRIQSSFTPEDTEGMAVATISQVPNLDVYEQIGIDMAEEYSFAIDVFVRDFIFG